MALFVRYLLGSLHTYGHHHTLRWQLVCTRESQGGNPIGKALVVIKYKYVVQPCYLSGDKDEVQIWGSAMLSGKDEIQIWGSASLPGKDEVQIQGSASLPGKDGM